MVLKSNISVNGIQRLIDGLKQYRKDLKQQTNKLISSLVSEGVAIAQNECPVRTGNLYNSIVGIMDGAESKGFIRVNCPYAIYVELGTGVKGATTPHPDPSFVSFPVVYDRNNHGSGGWWYPTDERDPNPTKYTTKDGKMYAWTGGMPSRPFMYNTAQELKRKIGGG